MRARQAPLRVPSHTRVPTRTLAGRSGRLVFHPEQVRFGMVGGPATDGANPSRRCRLWDDRRVLLATRSTNTLSELAGVVGLVWRIARVRALLVSARSLASFSWNARSSLTRLAPAHNGAIPQALGGGARLTDRVPPHFLPTGATNFWSASPWFVSTICPLSHR